MFYNIILQKHMSFRKKPDDICTDLDGNSHPEVGKTPYQRSSPQGKFLDYIERRNEEKFLDTVNHMATHFNEVKGVFGVSWDKETRSGTKTLIFKVQFNEDIDLDPELFNSISPAGIGIDISYVFKDGQNIEIEFANFNFASERDYLDLSKRANFPLNKWMTKQKLKTFGAMSK